MVQKSQGIQATTHGPWLWCRQKGRGKWTGKAVFLTQKSQGLPKGRCLNLVANAPVFKARERCEEAPPFCLSEGVQAGQRGSEASTPPAPQSRATAWAAGPKATASPSPTLKGLCFLAKPIFEHRHGPAGTPGSSYDSPEE